MKLLLLKRYDGSPTGAIIDRGTTDGVSLIRRGFARFVKPDELAALSAKRPKNRTPGSAPAPGSAPPPEAAPPKSLAVAVGASAPVDEPEAAGPPSGPTAKPKRGRPRKSDG